MLDKMEFAKWICNDDNESIFFGITTIIMLFLAVVAVITAIMIAYRQRQISKHDHVNNLAFELVVDFINPFNEYADTVCTFLSVTQGIEDKNLIKKLLEILDGTFLHTDFNYWEMHKGDINDALEKKGHESQISKINEFVTAARKHQSDVNNIKKAMQKYSDGENGENPINDIENNSYNSNSFYTEVSERGRKIIDDMRNSIDNLPEVLEIEDTCKKVKVNKRRKNEG